MITLSKGLRGYLFSDHHQVTIPSIFILLFLLFALPAQADNYSVTYTSGDGGWSGSQSYDFELGGYAFASQDASNGEIKVLTSVAGPGSGTASAWLSRDFHYDHHSWDNQFTLKYRADGILERIEPTHNLLRIICRLEELDNFNNPLATIANHTVFQKKNTNEEVHRNGSRSFTVHLEQDKLYRLTVTAEAECGGSDIGQEAEVDFFEELWNHLIQVDRFVVSHTHIEAFTWGDEQAGVDAHLEVTFGQNEFDYAHELRFRTETQDESAPVIAGWYSQIDHFDSAMSTRQNEGEIFFRAWAENTPDIPNGFDIWFHVRHYFSEHPSCSNACSLVQIYWNEDKKDGKEGRQVKVLPDHGWAVFHPTSVIGDPSLFEHEFRLVNEDEAEFLNVGSLRFLASEEFQEPMSGLDFPDSVHYAFTLPPGGSWVHPVVTSGQLYGGYIYFTYDLYNAAGDSVIANLWGGHGVSDPASSDVPDVGSSGVTGRWLHPNVPNPFNPQTKISFDLPLAQHVTLEVYAPDGKRVATLLNNHLAPGHYEIPWRGLDDDSRNLATGVYVYRLCTPKRTETGKMTLVK